MKTTFIKVIFSAMAFSFATVNMQAQETKTPPKPVATTPQKKAPMTPPDKLQARMNAAAHSSIANSNAPAAVKNLMKFNGRWVGNVTIVTEGKTHKVEYRLIGRSTAGGYGLYLDESFRDSTLGEMKASNLVGYDPNDEKIHWYSVDNHGSTHDHTGSWKSPDSLFMEHSGVRKGKTYQEKISVIFKGKEEVQLSLVATLDGKESEKISGVFQREKPPVRTKAPAPPVKEEKKE
ncbi:MAG: hypothetical protein V4615_08135 [Bacteroidota bacterium]